MTEDDIVKMARESGLSHPEMTAEGNGVSIGRMTRFAALVAQAEREACAELIEAHQIAQVATQCDWTRTVGQALAAAIRARSNI